MGFHGVVRMLCWLVLISPACAQVLPAAAVPPDSNEVLAKAIASRDENAERLKSAYGSGRLTHVLHEPSEPAPTILLDADVQFFYQPPKFRVHLIYSQRLLENTDRSDDTRVESTRWLDSEVRERIVVFDGHRLFSIKRMRGGSYEGEIYFGFAKMAVMRSAGFPFENPVTTWSQAINMDSLRPEQIELTRLSSGGYVGVLPKNTYYVKFFLRDRFGYDLQRVSSYRTGESQPFRDYLLTWCTSQDFHYVSRFVNSVASAHGNTATSAASTRTLTLQYDDFVANPTLEESVFQLDTIDLPDGTPFFDRRANVEGGPKQWVYRNPELVPADAD